MITAPGRPHGYEQRYASQLCTCGRMRAWRGHQPSWWRWLHPRARLR